MTRFVLAVSIASAMAVSSRVATSQNASHPEEATVRALIKTFADARNAHDGKAVAALYSEDGEWLGPNGAPALVRGRPALARMWGEAPGHVERTIQSIDFAGGNLAVVRVATQYAEPIGRRQETFVLVKDNGKWNIRVHQTVN